MQNVFFLLFIFLLLTASSFSKLSILNQKFIFNSSPIFLNGINQAWINYGDDFGNSQPLSKFCSLNQTLSKLKSSGGNSIRIWLHVEGDKTPIFNSTGYVTSFDLSGL